MARLIPASERLTRARALIQKARDLPIPAARTLEAAVLPSVDGIVSAALALLR